MDYPITLDQVYKDQSPFKLTPDDLFMVSQGGRTKVATIQELVKVITPSVLTTILDLLQSEVFNKLDKLSDLSNESQDILNNIKSKMNNKNISPRDLISGFMELLSSIIKTGG